MKHLINSKEVGELSRPISGHIDEDRVDSYISEAEQSKVKRVVGDALLKELLDVKETTEPQKLLLDGGSYEAGGQQRIVRGLRVAIAYYTYAKLVLFNPVNVTRFGTRTMENGQSQPIEWKQLQAIAIDAESYADSVLSECVDLLNNRSEDYPLYTTTGASVRTSRIRITEIGQ